MIDITREFKIGSLTVKVEVKDDLQGFRWRMTAEGVTTQWYSYYEGLCNIKTSQGTVIIATAYWEGLFPEFVPILLQPAELIDNPSQLELCSICHGTGYDKGTKCSCQDEV